MYFNYVLEVISKHFKLLLISILCINKGIDKSYKKKENKIKNKTKIISFNLF